VALFGELLADLAQAHALVSDWVRAPKALGKCHSLTEPLDLRLGLWGVPLLETLHARFSAFHALACLALAVAGSLELLHEAGFLELREDAGDLAHSDPHLVVTVGQVIATRCHHANAEAGQCGNAGLLGHEGTGEPAGVLHDDRADAITR